MSSAVSAAPRVTARQGTLARLKVRKVTPNQTAKISQAITAFRPRTAT